MAAAKLSHENQMPLEGRLILILASLLLLYNTGEFSIAGIAYLHTKFRARAKARISAFTALQRLYSLAIFS